MKPKASLRFLLGCSGLALIAMPGLHAQNHYWDSDGSTAGFGNTTGTWGTNAFWTTVAGGGATHSAVTNLTTAHTANFGSATLNYANANVDVAAGGVTATSIVFGAGQTTALTIGSASSGTITLGGATRTIIANSSGHRIWAPIELTGATTVRLAYAPPSAAATSLTLGALSGTGGATFENTAGGNPNPARFILTGASDYTGNTVLQSTVTNASVELRLDVDDALPTTTVLNLQGAAGPSGGSNRNTSLNLNGSDQTLAGLSNSGGGTLRTFRVFSSSAATLTINDSGTRTFSGLIGNGGTNIAIDKQGAGTWTLSGNNTYTGQTTINGGALRAEHANALGGTAAGTEVNGSGTASSGNARLELAGSISTNAGESLTIDGAGNFNGALTSTSGNNKWQGTVTIGSTGTRIGATANATLEVSGVIDSGVVSTGLNIRTANTTDSTVILSGANTYLGDTTLVVGKLQIAGDNDRLPVGTTLRLTGTTLVNATEFDLNGFNQKVAGLSLGGGSAAFNSVNNSSAAPSILTVNTAAAAPSTYAGKLDGNLGLTKEGEDSLTLTGTSNSYNGETKVNQGTLIVDGNISTSLLTTVNDSATLGGGGALGALTFEGGSFFDIFEAVDNTNPLDAATITFSTSGFGIGNLVSQGLAVDWSSIVDGTYTLITGTLDNTNLDNFGLANAYDLGDGRSAYFQSGGLQFVIVPEPRAALLGGIGVLLIFRRRRA
jgi:autotransporter-associated beta strand protein